MKGESSATYWATSDPALKYLLPSKQHQNCQCAQVLVPSKGTLFYSILECNYVVRISKPKLNIP